MPDAFFSFSKRGIDRRAKRSTVAISKNQDGQIIKRLYSMDEVLDTHCFTTSITCLQIAMLYLVPKHVNQYSSCLILGVSTSMECRENYVRNKNKVHIRCCSRKLRRWSSPSKRMKYFLHCEHIEMVSPR
jgi:hypothetical protein